MTAKGLLLVAAATLSIAVPSSALPPSGKAVVGAWGYDTGAMDRAVKPGDDFWAFVNGTWDRSTPIAPDRTSAGPFVKLADAAEIDVRAIVERVAADPSQGRVGQQVGDYYGSYVDQAAIDRAGFAPLTPYLARIAAVKDRTALNRLFLEPGFASPVALQFDADYKEPTRYSAFVGQARLGLPSREYYLSDDAKMVGHRAAYRAYIQTVQSLAGLPGGAASADRIIALETALSRAQWKAEDRRDTDKTYNPMTPAQLARFAPEFDWRSSLAAASLASQDQVVVQETTAVSGAGKLLASVPLSTWKEWLAFRFASDHASVLPKSLDDARFAFYSKQLGGVQQQRERWKRGVSAVDGALGEAVGEIYVRDHFPAASEQQMNELIANLRDSYRERILGNSWMDAATRKEALAKLATFDPRIGHPVKYIDYSAMKVVRGDALGNSVRAAQFDRQLELSRLAKPVDRSLWAMTPQTINAYYDSTRNQITFPAAILQAPYFDPNADAAVNYGAIGAVIGHEMGHGFDDEGRKFDAAGRLRDWWTPASTAAYTAHTAALAKQYDAFSPYPGVNVNGKLTLGENIGDLSGIEAAYGAYRKYVADHGEPPLIDGLTGDQRFFIGFAQAWQGKDREDAERQQILTDPHSPDKYRVNGVVRNFDPWYKAFGIKPGDAMYLPPAERVHIW